MEDVRLSCFKTCFLEYLITTLSIFKEAICLNHIKTVDSKSNSKSITDSGSDDQHFLKFIKINFSHSRSERRICLNMYIERDDQFCMEYVVYVLLAIDMFISMLGKTDDKHNNDNDNDDNGANRDNYDGKKTRRSLIDISYINRNVLLAEDCKSCENSLYGFAAALLENRVKPFSFLFLSRNKKNFNDYYAGDPTSVFFTADEIKSISRRIKTSRKNERIKIILSKYKKKIKDDSTKSENGLVLRARATNILIRCDGDNDISMDVCVHIVDKESYVWIKTIEKQTKQLNKSLIDYLDALVKIDDSVCPDRLRVVNDVIAFKERMTDNTHKYFPAFKFNGSRKYAAISRAIETLADECEPHAGTPQYRHTTFREHCSYVKDNYGSFEPFMNTMLPLLVNETITNIWFNRLFLLNTQREVATNNDIRSTGFLSFLKDVEREADKTKVMDVLRKFSNVCVTLRRNRLPFPLREHDRPTKRQKNTAVADNRHNESQPLRDLQYIQTLSKGTVNVKSLSSHRTLKISGDIVVGKYGADDIVNETNSNSNTSRSLANIDAGQFLQYFTPIAKDLFAQ
uniref:Uncharacterized protein n=1 Tax=Penaeus semisulcatus majanivirus TaxID=2984274 RepID=A0A9C7BHN2_9VIRU|nr:MAG: hypothetical protein [Penaeus semisulcatus majanivirus]